MVPWQPRILLFTLVFQVMGDTCQHHVKLMTSIAEWACAFYRLRENAGAVGPVLAGKWALCTVL
jgi:hypothetical protein